MADTVVPLLLDTLTLSRDGHAGTLRDRWANADTAGLQALITFEGCPPWLYRRLKVLGATPGTSGTLDTWLADASKKIAAHNLLVDSRTDIVAQELEALGIPHVFLKGAALRACADRYPYADARVTSDVDVLLPEEQAESAWRRFRASGYRVAGDPNLTPDDHYHLVPLASDDAITVELHTSISDRVDAAGAWERFWRDARHVTRAGARLAIPTETELLWHGLVHALPHGTWAFRLRFFLDIAVLIAGKAPIDWDLIEHRLGSYEIADRPLAAGWLAAATGLAGTGVPERILAGAWRFPLDRVLHWRLAVLRRYGLQSRWAAKLVEQGTRLEVGMPVWAGVPGASPLLHLRRRTAASATGMIYRVWRSGPGRVSG